MSPSHRLVVIGSTGAVGRSLCAAAGSVHQVLAVSSTGTSSPTPFEPAGPGVWQWQADCTSLPETEIALAGAHTVVFAARTLPKTARLTQASSADLDLLLADTVARAAMRTKVTRVVVLRNHDNDAVVKHLERGAVPVTVVSSADELAKTLGLAPSSFVVGSESHERQPRPWVVSAQRFILPPKWSADDAAFAYCSWLSDTVPGVRSERVGDTVLIRFAGSRLLVFHKSSGRSRADSCWLDIADGSLVGGSKQARFDFRVLLGGTEVMAVLNRYEPRLPWPLYRATQALVHASIMRRFGKWLELQTDKPSALGATAA